MSLSLSKTKIHLWLYVAALLFLLLWLPQGSQAAEPSAAAGQPAAPQEKALRLEDAVRIALENHPSIKAGQEQIGAQEAVLKQQLGGYYPTISLVNSYATANSTSTDSGTDSTGPNGIDTFSSQANVSMTLYDFGKREGNVQSARDTVQATRYAYTTTANNVVLSVKQAYYAYLQAVALLRVREQAVKDQELLVNQARGFYEVGTRAKIDVARAEANFYSAQADLVTAQNNVQVALVTLKNAIGIPELPGVPQTAELTVIPPPVSLEDARKTAFISRPELLQFEAQRKAQDQQIATARRGHLPDFLVSANYGRRNTSREGDTFPLQPRWQVQLNFNIPLFDGFRTTYRVEQAVRTYYSVKNQEEQQRQQVALEVEQSYLNMVQAEGRIRANEAAEQAAKENFDLATGRYQVGVGSIIEVTDAETLYVTAQSNLINSRYDFKIAEAQLARAMGGQ
jgi:outer membrane protein